MKDYKKVAVYDSRLVQKPMKYAVNKGALSVSTNSFSAISKTRNGQNFNIQVPSLNVYVDKEIKWTCETVLKLTVDRPDWRNANGVNNRAYNAGNRQPVIRLVGDIALDAFPLHKMVSSMSATINDAVCNINTSSVLSELLLLTDSDPNLKYNMTTPSYVSKYAINSSSTNAHNNPINGFYDQEANKPKNGAYYDVSFVTDPTGNTAATLDDLKETASTTANPAGGFFSNATYDLYIKFRATENLFLSPFSFVSNNECSLFGVNNIQVQMNLREPSRVFSYAGPGDSTCTVSYASESPFREAKLTVKFLTPPLDLELPKVSITPYMSFDRAITNRTVAFVGGKASLTSSTITLPSIPDFLIISCKKQNYSNKESEWYMPITKISIQFDNYSGICSTLSKEELYQISYENGLKLDYNVYSGGANTPNGLVPTLGGFLILKMGKNIPLQAGMSPGVGGNFSLQFNCEVELPKGNIVAPTDVQLNVMTPNSGYFMTKNGSSMIMKNLLSEGDVMEATGAETEADERVIGGSFWNKMSSAMGQFVANPAVQRVAEKMITKKLGLGASAASVSGGKKSRKIKLSNLL